MTDVAAFPPIRRLTPADLPALLELRATTAGLPPGFIWPKSETQLRSYLEGPSAAFGVPGEDGALGACSLLRLPSAREPDPGPAFPLVPPADWPLRACGLESTVVRAAARGRGLQRALIRARLAHAAQAGAHWACVGVHLENVVSWTNLLAEHFMIVGTRSDLGFVLLALLRSLAQATPRTDPGDRWSVGAGDPADHRAALEAGYVGVRSRADGLVTYERLVTSCRTLPLPGAGAAA